MNEIAGRGWVFRSPRTQRAMRQVLLFVAMLMSGGLLLFPRIPLLATMLILGMLLANPVHLFQRAFMRVWFVMLAVAAMALIGGQSFQIEPMAIRYANFACGLMLLLVYSELPRDKLSDDIFPLLRLMAIQAILTPVAAILLPGLFATMELEGATYHTFYLLFTYHEFSSPALFKRPDGFFFEPGVFQFYLNTMLFIALFMRRFHWRDVLLAIGGVIATQSTTGAVIMVALLAGAYVMRIRDSASHEVLLVIVLIPLLIAPVVYYSYGNLTEKFTGTQAGSAWAREYDLRTGLAVVKEYPVTGIGFDYDKYFEVAGSVGYKETNLSNDNITDRPNSNGIITLFYTMGIPLALLFLWGFLRQRLLQPRAFFGIVVIISLLSEALAYTPFFIALVFSGLLIGRKRNTVASTIRPVSRAGGKMAVAPHRAAG